ncbi:histidine phosphatase [Acuticoccus sediminis]|uniref:Histidine phosphatase n=1 Tax=Acuticoccus sediminis TaxID=2184697 RepID=A0A8B2P0U1_9HYPH|nr:histidine phosphatase family protein [Acuticoccus sediminis]RAI04065.1 histidine phosphatase [Acuticoccus sediminis]
MRYFIIMRHAKAEAGENKLDFDRSLVERGWNEADSTARQLAEHGLTPDTILCSAARRTRDTLSAVMPHVTGDCIVHLRRSLYEADVTDLRDALRKVTGQRVLVIGHNPTVHELALEFAGQDGAALAHGFPTSTAAVFTLGFGLDTIRFDGLITP